MFGHAPQHFHQCAALLSRPDHVHVHVGKNHRVPPHPVRKAPAFHDVLFELFAHFGRNALGLQMGQAVQRHRQRHARLQQVGQLLRERGQFLEPGFALTIQKRAQSRRQNAR